MDTRISIYKLGVFCEVVDSGSVTRAATKLGVAQPVVTAHLRSLERRLGVKLVEREGRGIALTPAGQVTYRWATDVVGSTRQVGTLLEALRHEGDTNLSVATGVNSASNGIAHAVVRFQLSHPGTHLDLRVLPTEEALATVLAGETEFAIVSYLEWLWVDPSLRVQHLAADELVLVAAPSLVAQLEAPDGSAPATARVSATQLAELEFVCTPGGTVRRTVIDASLRERGVEQRRVVMEVRSETVFHAAVRDGAGYALLSRRSALDMIGRGELAVVEMPHGPIALTIDLVSRRDLPARPLHGLFREAIQQEMLAKDLSGVRD